MQNLPDLTTADLDGKRVSIKWAGSWFEAKIDRTLPERHGCIVSFDDPQWGSTFMPASCIRFPQETAAS